MATASLRAPKPKDSTTTLTVDNTGVLEVAFNADVQPAKGGPAPTGNVTFRDNNNTTVISTVAIGSSFSATARPMNVTATYNGDSQYASSKSATVTPP